MTKHNRPQSSKRTTRFLRELQDFNPYALIAFAVGLLVLLGWILLR